MSIKLITFNIIIFLFMQSVIAQPGALKPTIVDNDPYKVREYTLTNGLKVYISINKQSPRVQTMIAVKAGSKYDPATTTGLAHYLEHMMFKGTHKYGTIDWAKEKPLIEQISNLYESHLQETKEEGKKAIYAKIDALSNQASKLAIPSEYDKMVSTLGASGTNAFTSNDMTVYVNDIPSNSLDKWASLESERFSTLVLRLFHTELETVYEEFNRTQDDDARWASQAVDSMLMPNHPYGTQTTIGRGEHLKNPSMVNIHRYFDTYYNPNNVAIILVGDVDPDKAVASIEKHFGKWSKKDIPVFQKEEPIQINETQMAEIKGPTKELVYMGFRLDGDGTQACLMAKMMDMILSNGSTGLLDMNLVQQQKVLSAQSYVQAMKDYSVFKFYGEPKKGQTLEQVKDLLLSQVEAVKRGEFADWLIPAIIKNLQLDKLKAQENNRAVASELMDAFVKDISWTYRVKQIDEMSKINKEDIVRFANENFRTNYAVCYKRIGEPNRHKVEKPTITPVTLNKDSTSAFKASFDKVIVGKITPKFVDFNKDMETTKLAKGNVLRYVHNELNRTFSLTYVYHIGTDADKSLGNAAEYLSLLGTEKQTVAQLKEDFYKIGVSYKINASRDRLTVNLSGLENGMEQGVKMMANFIATAKPDSEVYKGYLDDVQKKRANAKITKGVILGQAMLSYAKYGGTNPYKNVLNQNELASTKPAVLVGRIMKILSSPNEIYYFGQNKSERVRAALEPVINGDMTETGKDLVFKELPIAKSEVLFYNYNMKQAEVIMLGRDEPFNKSLLPYITLYNDYYGAGLSSVLFQEVREKMGLAYAVNSNFGAPANANESHYLQCYVGTQADKLPTTMAKMSELLNKMVSSPKQFEGAKTNALKNLESEWVTGEGIFAAYDRATRRGLAYDLRKDMYEKIPVLTVADLKTFFDKHIKGKAFTYLIIGKKDNVKLEALKEIGPAREIAEEEIFGF